MKRFQMYGGIALGRRSLTWVGRSLPGLLAPAVLASVALADIPFPVQDVLPYLEARTTVPILLPDTVPLTEVERVYVSSEANTLSYVLSIDYTEDCGGATPCTFGALSAEVDGFSFDPDDLFPGDTFELVTLADGTEAGYFNLCGAYCSAILQWEEGGVLYTVYLKNGTQEDLLAIANSAIAAGPR